jgi:hypothetical protein
LSEAVEWGFVDASKAFGDATHIKASASKKKAVNEAVTVEAKHYQAELTAEIQADREKPLKYDDDEPPKHDVKRSTTDPECGLFHKGEHKVEFAYTTHVFCDKHNFVLCSDVSAGSVHDSVMFDGLYKKLIVEGFFRKYDYVYDEYYDCVLCPQNHVLEYSTTNRDGYREYKSDPEICRHCPVRSQCTESKNCQKVVTRHVWEDYIELAEDVRHSPEGKEIYALRSQTIERIFADAKELHFMRYTFLRGLVKLKMQTTLIFACMNLKKLAKWKRFSYLFSFFSDHFFQKSCFVYFCQCKTPI